MVKTGESAPSFTLPSTSGAERSLGEFRGKKVVIFFYPKDETPGCTREACGFRDNYSAIRDAGAEVIGISKDSLSSHDKFRANHALPFELLSDSDNVVASAYGAYGEKKMYGRTVMGTIRSTVLVDENGNVEHVWSPVRVDGHVEQVVERLGATPAAPSGDAVKATKKKATQKKATKKKATKKKATKKKATKKKATKKKATKKKATKKKATKKKATKKKATKKKATQKKATQKKATKKKATKKKATKKKATKKKATKKKATKKKATKKKAGKKKAGKKKAGKKRR